MPEEWCLGKFESGWMRSDVCFEYITDDFNSWVDRNSIKKSILLLSDGYKPHMVLSAKIDIILYALHPNTTHMLQPADVSVIAPLTSSWKAVVGKFLSKPENVNSCVNKTNFCQLFRDTLEDNEHDHKYKKTDSENVDCIRIISMLWITVNVYKDRECSQRTDASVKGHNECGSY